MTSNIPTSKVLDFWQGFEKIVGQDALAGHNKDHFPDKRESEAIVKSVRTYPVDLQVDLVEYLLPQFSVGQGMFRNLMSLIGKIPAEDETRLIAALLEHRHSEDFTAYEIFGQASRMRDKDLKATVKKLGIDLTRPQLLEATRALVAQRSSLGIRR